MLTASRLQQLAQSPHLRRNALAVAVFTLLVLRSRLLKLPQEILDNVLQGPSAKKLSAEELVQVLQQVYEKGPDGSKLVLVPHRQRISKVCSCCAVTALASQHDPRCQSYLRRTASLRLMQHALSLCLQTTSPP